MPIPRLFIDTSLHEQAEILLGPQQAHYVQHVMRLKQGDEVSIFNGADGEWRGSILEMKKKHVILTLTSQYATQRITPDIWLLFAPIKAGRIDFLVEKATELGVSALWPVKTARTIVSRVNEQRLRANAIEAAEQTERLDIPEIYEYTPLASVLHQWDTSRTLIYGDESGGGAVPSSLLPDKTPPLAILVGPEGGFSPEEFHLLKQMNVAHALSLGPRVMRADTAALASMTLLQLYCGDLQNHR